jgi:hypothetical protein
MMLTHQRRCAAISAHAFTATDARACVERVQAWIEETVSLGACLSPKVLIRPTSLTS